MGDSPGLMLTHPVGRIEATPEHHSVIKGAKVTYRFVTEEQPLKLYLPHENDGEQQQVDPAKVFDRTGRSEQPIPHELLEDYQNGKIGQTLAWLVIYDKQAAGADIPPFDWVARGTDTVEITWRYPGEHVILIRMGWFAESPTKSPRDQAATHILFRQRVDENVQTIQRRRVERRLANKPLPHPQTELDAMRGYIDAVESAERTHGVPNAKEKEYRHQLAQKKQYRDLLEEMIAADDGAGRWYEPIYASYVSKKTSEQVDLRVAYIATMNGIPKIGRKDGWLVRLIDWTNPLDKRLRGIYEGKGETIPDALEAAIGDWRENNEYFHPGNVRIEVPPDSTLRRIDKNAKPTHYQFDTPGAGFWGKLQEFLEAIGLALTIVLIAVAAVVPIPGSQVVAGLVWASVFTSAGAAAINIGRRKRNGFADSKDDAFDALTIVASVFTAGRAGLARNAMLSTRAIGGQLQKFALLGEVTAEAVQGLMIAVDKAKELDTILNDPTLSPSERVDRMLSLVKQAAATGALTYINVRGSKAKGRTETLVDEPTLKRLKDPNQTIDLDALKKQRGNTGDGAVRTKVQDEPERAPTSAPEKKKPEGGTRPLKPGPVKKPKRGKTDFAEAPHPHKRGMTAQDDFDFEEAALATDRIYLCRDSNEAALKHMQDKTKGPKPEDLKAKTLKSGKNVGLAAASPTDPRLTEMLAAMPSKKTGKPPMPYDEFVETQLTKKGFWADPNDDYVVKSDKYSGGYYSDYDLHGVYDKKGNDVYNEAVRKDLNDRFGREMVQHGPHDDWPKRNHPEAGPNRGPQPPVTAYVPINGEVKKFHLTTREEMKAFYEAWDIPWSKIYPDH